MCQVGSCNAGWGHCPGDANNCSTPLNTVNNCGACGNVCTTSNGTPACVPSGNTFVCAVGSCNPGFQHCAPIGTDCETNTNIDDTNCGSCGNSCNVSCNAGGTGHVMSTACTNGICDIQSCTGTYVDFDQSCSDGCECLASLTQALCTNAISLFSGVLQPGQSITPYTANMAPRTVTDAWFTLTFGGNGQFSFHPKITITSLNNEFEMNVNSNCAGGTLNTCGDNGTSYSDGVLTWEEFYTAGDPTSKTAGGASNFNAIALPGSNGQVWIHVYRKNGATPTCNQYTITASD
jgi:hypothetical protein